MVDNVLYAKLVEANCRWFDFEGCVFSESNMSAKDSRDTTVGKAGSGRVATYRMTGLTHVYTLECNYNMGKRANRLAHPHVPEMMDQNRSLSPQPPLKCLSPKYTPECWRAVGKALAISALDMTHANPCSRLGAPGEGFKMGYNRLRSTVTAWVRTNERKQKEKAAKRAAAEKAGGKTKSGGGGGSDEEGSDEDAGGGSDAEEGEEKESGGKEVAQAGAAAKGATQEAVQAGAATKAEANPDGPKSSGGGSENSSPQEINISDPDSAAAQKPPKRAPLQETELSRAEPPYWVGIDGTPLVRKGFSLKSQPNGRLDAGSKVQVLETRLTLEGGLRGAIALEGGLGEHGWMTLIMKDGAENVRYLGEGGEGGGKVDGVETDGAAADAADAIMGGFGAAAARRAKKVVEPVAERESAGGAAFII